MTVLVGFDGSRGPVTRVAEEIADRLRKGGFGTAQHELAEVADFTRYEALVIGRGAPSWTRTALGLFTDHTHDLIRRPLWLFQVGGADPVNVDELRFGFQEQTLSARGYRHFEVGLDRGEWQRLGDLLLQVCGGQRSQPTSLGAVDEWANGIARDLQLADHARERRRLHVSVRGRG